MRARSLVVNLFGDYLRYRDGEVRLRGLVALLDCFGVPAPTARVTVGRLRDEGWLAARREGRESVLSLTGTAWRLLDEGRERIFGRSEGPWDGQWHMVIYQVPEVDRTQRERLRQGLAWLGFGPLAPSVWVSPHDRVPQVRQEFGGLPSVQLDAFRSRSEGNAADRGIAARAWDLAELDRDYREMLDRYAPRLDGYRAGALEDRAALVERMELLHHYRVFPYRDPDLPAELLPADWPGHRAHEVFLAAHELLREPAERIVDRLTG